MTAFRCAATLGLVILGLPGLAAGRGLPLDIWGIWAECEGVNSTLSSRRKIEEMFDRLSEAGFNTVMLQVYRRNRAWYRSGVADAEPYREFHSKEGDCPLRLAIDMAHARGMKIHAWMNMFRVRGDRNAKVIRDLGERAVTRDATGRSMLDYGAVDLPDGGYWLDPGDARVRAYLLAVIRELLDRYPDIDGIHLDYVRYPYDDAERADFGYGVESVSGFRKRHGFSPAGSPPAKRKFWDAWRRDQLTMFIADVKKLVGGRGKTLSAAVIPDEGRRQSLAFQDWPRWLSEGIIDLAVPMNYGSDRSAVRSTTGDILKAAADTKKVAIGLGAYKVLNAPRALLSQVEDCRNIGARGVILFSYDNMAQHPGLFAFLGREVCGAKGIARRPARQASDGAGGMAGRDTERGSSARGGINVR